MSHLILVDASAFAYRAYHSTAPGYREEDGEPIGAVLGFMSLVWRLLGAAEADKPTHGAAIFDAPGKNFRHKLFPAYKANRPAARATELSKQLVIMRSAADVLGLMPLELKGFEADDLIATLAMRAARGGMRTTIVSSDKDFSQLVKDGEIEIVDPMSRGRILEADVLKKFGVVPALVPDVQALAGDAIDGIPGIPGIGLDKAGALIRRMGSLEALLKQPDACRWLQARAELKRGRNKARLYLKLTTLRRDVPLKVSFDSLLMKPVMRSHLEEIAKALGASARVDALFDLDPQTVRVVDTAEDPFEWWREELLARGQRLPDLPQCGFYKRKLVKGGTWIVGRIWREPETGADGKPTGKELLRCDVGGKVRDANAEWARLAMYPVPEAEYRYEIADSDHAKKYRPDDPKAAPHKAIDIRKMPAQYPPRTQKEKTP